MNKKYIAFGLMGFFAIALASAMVVDYLSNTVTGDVTIESPLELSGDIIGTFDRYAGESITKNVIMTNKANVPITTHAEFTIVAPEDWDVDGSGVATLDEFDSLTLKETTVPFDAGSIKSTCLIDNTNSKVLNCELLSATIPNGGVFNYEITAQFNQAIAEGTYSFTVQAMN